MRAASSTILARMGRTALLRRSAHAANRGVGATAPRRIKTQTVLPSAETAAMLFWALLASGQITIREVNGWQTLGEMLAAPVDLAAQSSQPSSRQRCADQAISTQVATAPSLNKRN